MLWRTPERQALPRPVASPAFPPHLGNPASQAPGPQCFSPPSLHPGPPSASGCVPGGSQAADSMPGGVAPSRDPAEIVGRPGRGPPLSRTYQTPSLLEGRAIGVPPCCSIARVDGHVLLAEPFVPRACCHSSARRDEDGQPAVTGRLCARSTSLSASTAPNGRRLARWRPVPASPPPRRTAGHRQVRPPPSRPPGRAGGQGPRRRQPLRWRTRATCCSPASAVSRPRPRRPRSCAGRARRTAVRHANAPRRARTRR